jgi:hypothetical protein
MLLNLRSLYESGFNNIRQAIINGLVSAQSETFGWNNEVKDKLEVISVERTSDTVVTITLSAQSSYNITSNETITVTIPASALTFGESIVATPTMIVSALTGWSHKINNISTFSKVCGISTFSKVCGI